MSPQKIALKLHILAYIATQRMLVALIPTTSIWRATILKELSLNVAFKQESLPYLMDIRVMSKGILSLTIRQPSAATYMSSTRCQNWQKKERKISLLKRSKARNFFSHSNWPLQFPTTTRRPMKKFNKTMSTQSPIKQNCILNSNQILLMS